MMEIKMVEYIITCFYMLASGVMAYLYVMERKQRFAVQSQLRLLKTKKKSLHKKVQGQKNHIKGLITALEKEKLSPTETNSFMRAIRAHLRAQTPEDIRRADVLTALHFGYKVCDCTDPPQIMLTRQYKNNETYWYCEGCGNSIKHDRD